MSSATAFSPTANPKAYVPNAGAERALEALREWSSDSRRPIVLLEGAPGMGKTLLLKVFAVRAREHGRFRPIYVPNPDCHPKDFCHWVLRDLDPESSEDPRAALTRAAAALGAERNPLLLLVDEAESLPPATADWLFDAARGSNGAMRIVLAFTDGQRCAATAATLGADAVTVRIDTLLSRSEVEAHVRSELELAAVEPALRACFDDATIDELHVRSAGVPALFQNEAAAILCRAEIRRGTIRRIDAATVRSVASAEPDPVATRAAPAKRRAVPEPVARPGAPEAVANATSAVASAPATKARPSRRPRTLRTGWWAGLACGMALGLISSLILSEQRSRSGGDALPVAALTNPIPPVAAAPPDSVESADDPIYRVASAPVELHASPAGDGGKVAAAEVITPPPPSSAPAPVRLAAVAAPVAPDESALARIAPPPPAPAAAKSVLVSINAEPWATIEIDGRAAGETPIAGVPLTRGRHRFAARMPDGRTDERVVEVDAKNRRIVFR